MPGDARRVHPDSNRDECEVSAKWKVIQGEQDSFCNRKGKPLFRKNGGLVGVAAKVETGGIFSSEEWRTKRGTKFQARLKY